MSRNHPPWRQEVLGKVVVSCGFPKKLRAEPSSKVSALELLSAGSTTQNLHAELSSNASALELRSAGLTPQNLHTELPSNGCPQRKPPTESCSFDDVSWPLVIYSGDLLINPVSLGDGEWTWTGLWLRGCTLYVAGIPGLQVFIEYMAMDVLKFASVPGSFGDRGDTPRWGLMAGTAACCTRFVRCCPFVSLYSHSQRSCRPQPR